jgi:hypothetical protein
MKTSRKPWRTKLRPEMQPELGTDPKTGKSMLCPTPMLVAEEIGKIPERSLLTVAELRNRMARRFGAEITCPLMTGIFFNLVAGAAEEGLAEGQKALAPYWRVVMDKGVLSPKTPFGPERQAEHLRDEGHKVEARRAKFAVVGYMERLAP